MPARPHSAQLRVLNTLLFLLLLLVAPWGTACDDAGPPLTAQEQSRLLEASEMRFLRDPTRALGIDEVASPERQGDFRPVKGDLSFGFTRDVVWVRLCVRQDAATNVEWRLASRTPYLDDVRLYTRKDDGNGWFELRSGDLVAVNDRPLPYRSALFPIILKGDHPEEIYIRLQASTGLTTALTLARPEAFQVQSGRDLLVIGVVLGLLIMVIAINAINWIWTGQALYIGLAGFVAVILAGMACVYGVAGFYLFPDNAQVSHVAGRVLNCLFMGGTIMLIRGPLRMAEHFPRFNRILPYVASVIALFALSVPFDYYVTLTPIAQAFQPVMMLAGVIACWRNIRQGHKGAKWMLAAFLCFALPLLANVARILGVLAWNSNSEIAAPAVAAYGLFLHFAILSQLRQEQEARAAATAASDAQRRLAEQEERLRSEQSLFFAFAAHELRGPLGIILTAAGNLKRAEERDDPAQSARITRLTQAAQRMTGLIDRHLRLQRMGQPGFEPHMEPEPTDLPARRALQAARALHSSRPLDLRLSGRQGLEVEMDAELITMALSNLLDNAAKYSDEGTPIRLELDRDDDSVHYRVINQGPAPAPEHLEGEFRVFRRSAASERTRTGFGIGLALTDHVARAHGGSLACAHTAGESCFTLSIPLHPPAAQTISEACP